MTWVIHTVAQGASNRLMSFRKSFKSSSTLRCVFSLSSCCQFLIPSSSSLPSFHLDYHKQTHKYYRRITQNSHPSLQQTLACSQILDIAMMDTKAGGWKLKLDVTSNQGLVTAEYMSLQKCVCVLFFSKMTHFWAMSSYTYMHILTMPSQPPTYVQPHKHTHTQINTPSNTHSITDCNWQMSHSRQPIETWRDGVIVVTLVYWCLSIHLRAHVSVFSRWKERWRCDLLQIVWPHLSVQSLSYYHFGF